MIYVGVSDLIRVLRYIANDVVSDLVGDLLQH